MARALYDFDDSPLPYEVRSITFTTARDFVVRHHYSAGMTNNTSAAYGLYEGAHLIGAASFSTPCSENVRASVFGAAYRSHVTELSRLVILDVTPRNAESWLIARCMARLRVDRAGLWAVVSFADPTEGHVGTIYQATNALYYGVSERRMMFRDLSGRLRHRRQCGRNVSAAEARAKGWKPDLRQGKHRYCFRLPAENGQHLPPVLLGRLPYPKASTMNGLFDARMEVPNAAL